MDAKSLLRRYLEQRRELGESELVLDSLQVDEVMRMLGAVGRQRAEPKQSSLRELAEEISGDNVQDWRTSLRQAGVNVETAMPSTPHAFEPKSLEPETSLPVPQQTLSTWPSRRESSLATKRRS